MPEEENEEKEEEVLEEEQQVEEKEQELELDSSTSGRVSIINSGDYHNNIMSNFIGSINTNNGDIVVNYND